MFKVLIALSCVTAIPSLARELAAQSHLYSHGTIRLVGQRFEAVVEIASELAPNLHAGQQVSMDVRQGPLTGTIKDIRSAMEITIAVDSQARFRLQPGQAVLAVIHLDADGRWAPSKHL